MAGMFTMRVLNAVATQSLFLRATLHVDSRAIFSRSCNKSKKLVVQSSPHTGTDPVIKTAYSRTHPQIMEYFMR